MNFKIPNIVNYLINPESTFRFFREYFGRIYGSDLIKHVVFEFSGWDMDTVSSFSVPYPSELSYKKITSIDLMIYSDNGVSSYDSRYSGITSVSVQSSDSLIVISRSIGGLFDSSDFSSTSVTRGEIRLSCTT